MSNKKLYIRYIAYHIENYPFIARGEWRSLLKERLEVESINSVQESKVKSLAFSLYFAYFASLISCTNYWMIITKLKTPGKIFNLLEDSEKIRTEHKLGFSGIYFKTEGDIVYYKIENNVIEHMKNFQGSTETIENIINPEEPKRKVKSTVKSTVKPSPKKPPTVKPSPKKPPTVKPSPKKSKTISSYTVKELREMATSKNIPGRSKMNKAELFRALKL